MATPSQHGVILFGHGARDARWAEPFQKLAEALTAQRAAQGAAGPVALAFLESMTPDLAGAVRAQAEAGCAAITVIPVFFGRGAHLREDLPKLVAACQAEHPDIALRVTDAVGEMPQVIEAIARVCVGAIDG
jgi:sirohydrochlorin cobaltochelatase